MSNLSLILDSFLLQILLKFRRHILSSIICPQSTYLASSFIDCGSFKLFEFLQNLRLLTNEVNFDNLGVDVNEGDKITFSCKALSNITVH